MNHSTSLPNLQCQNGINVDLRNQMVQKFSSYYPNATHSHQPDAIERLCYERSEGNKEIYLRLCAKVLNPFRSVMNPQPIQSPVNANNNINSSNIINPQIIHGLNGNMVIQSPQFNHNSADPMNALQNLTNSAGQSNIMVHSIQQQQPQSVNNNAQIQLTSNMNTININQPIQYNSQPIRHISPTIQRHTVDQYRTQLRPTNSNQYQTIANNVRPVAKSFSTPSSQIISGPILNDTINNSGNFVQPQVQIQSNIHMRPNFQYQQSRFAINTNNNNNINNNTTPYTAIISLPSGTPLQSSNIIPVTATFSAPNTSVYHTPTTPISALSAPSPSQEHNNVVTRPSASSSYTQPSSSPAPSLPTQSQTSTNKPISSSATNTSATTTTIGPSSEESIQVNEALNKMRLTYLPHLKLVCNNVDQMMITDETHVKFFNAIYSLLEHHSTHNRRIYMKNIPKLTDMCQLAEKYARDFLARQFASSDRDSSSKGSSTKSEDSVVIPKRGTSIGITERISPSSSVSFLSPCLYNYDGLINRHDPTAANADSSSITSESLDNAFIDVIQKLKKCDPKILQRAKKRLRQWVNYQTPAFKRRHIVTNSENEEESHKISGDYKEGEFDLLDNWTIKYEYDDHSQIEIVPANQSYLDMNGFLLTNIDYKSFSMNTTNRSVLQELKSLEREFYVEETVNNVDGIRELFVTYKLKNISIEDLPIPYVSIKDGPENSQFSEISCRDVNYSHNIVEWDFHFQHQNQNDNCMGSGDLLNRLQLSVEKEFAEFKKSYYFGAPLILVLSTYKRAILRCLSQ